MAAVIVGAQGIALVLLAIQPLLVPAVGLFWFVYLMMGMIDSPRGTLINNEIPAARRSSMLSVFSLAVYAGAFLGNAGLGFVAEQASIGASWFVAGSVLAASLLLYLRVDGRLARQVEEQGAGSKGQVASVTVQGAGSMGHEARGTDQVARSKVDGDVFETG